MNQPLIIDKAIQREYNKYQTTPTNGTIGHRFTTRGGDIVIPVFSSRYTLIIKAGEVMGKYRKCIGFKIHPDNERLKLNQIKI